jgi:hypothetical protein
LDGDGRGRIEMSRDGCIHLQGRQGAQDLVWPSDWESTGSSGQVLTDSSGARLGVGHKVSLVGAVQQVDEPLKCHVTDEGVAFYVVDFMGKTTGGG